MPKTRVLVVEDSLTGREKHLIEVLGADPDLTVAGEAEDGKQAIELCQTLRPDVERDDIGRKVWHNSIACFPSSASPATVRSGSAPKTSIRCLRVVSESSTTSTRVFGIIYPTNSRIFSRRYPWSNSPFTM